VAKLLTPAIAARETNQETIRLIEGLRFAEDFTKSVEDAGFLRDYGSTVKDLRFCFSSTADGGQFEASKFGDVVRSLDGVASIRDCLALAVATKADGPPDRSLGNWPQRP
jgi:hypothetical protein